MKKLIMLVFAGLLYQFAVAQNDITQYLTGGKADATFLAQKYLNPYAMALGDGLNNGWYNSAATHKLFGLDLSISVSAVQIPNSAKTFIINNSDLKELKVSSGQSVTAPTVANSKDIMGPELIVKASDKVTLNTPNGVGMDVFPVPVAQLTFGLLPHTDFILRYVPKIKYDNEGDVAKLGTWGVGVKNNIKEWMPGLKNIPFDLAIFGCYSEINGSSGISFEPQDYNYDNVTITFTNADNQSLELKTKTSKYGIVVSKKIGVLTIFGGLGKSTSETSIDLLGKYPIVKELDSGELVIRDSEALYDPISLRFNSDNVSMDAGLRLKLAIFSIYGSINKAEYLSYNAGISLGFR